MVNACGVVSNHSMCNAVNTIYFCHRMLTSQTGNIGLQYVNCAQYMAPLLVIIKTIWHKIAAFLCSAGTTPCLPSNLTFTHFHPFAEWLLTPLPNTPSPRLHSSIIRPELIAMHFTAEVGKLNTWISTMYPYPHTYAASPSRSATPTSLRHATRVFCSIQKPTDYLRNNKSSHSSL